MRKFKGKVVFLCLIFYTHIYLSINTYIYMVSFQLPEGMLYFEKLSSIRFTWNLASIIFKGVLKFLKIGFFFLYFVTLLFINI